MKTLLTKPLVKPEATPEILVLELVLEQVLIMVLVLRLETAIVLNLIRVTIPRLIMAIRITGLLLAVAALQIPALKIAPAHLPSLATRFLQSIRPN